MLDEKLVKRIGKNVSNGMAKYKACEKEGINITLFNRRASLEQKDYVGALMKSKKVMPKKKVQTIIKLVKEGIILKDALKKIGVSIHAYSYKTSEKDKNEISQYLSRGRKRISKVVNKSYNPCIMQFGFNVV